VKASVDGLSDQPISDIVAGCLAEIDALPVNKHVEASNDGMLSFPSGNSKVEHAIDGNGNIIGVNITMLVLPENFSKLPYPYRELATRVLAFDQNGLIK
jgi:hypothetical protein